MTKKIAQLDDMIEADFFNAVQGLINKELKNAVVSLNDDAFITRWLSTGSIMLDTVISNKQEYGGYPGGRITEIAGLEGTGKSLLGIEAVKSTQRLGGYAMYIDVEHAINPEWVIQTLGLDPQRLNYITKLDTMEDIFIAIEKMLGFVLDKSDTVGDKPITIIWDSIAQTTTKAELEGEYGKAEMAIRARILSQSIRKISGALTSAGAYFIGLNQFRANIGNMFHKWTTPCGNAMRFAASLRLELSRSKPIEYNDAVIGYKTLVKTSKNKCQFSAPDKRTCEFDILFNKGIDETMAIFDFLVSAEVIKRPTSKSYAFTINDVEKRFAKSDWAELFNGDMSIRQWAIGQAKKELVVDMNNLDYTKKFSLSKPLVDFEYGQLDAVNGASEVGANESIDDDDNDDDVPKKIKLKKKIG